MPVETEADSDSDGTVRPFAGLTRWSDAEDNIIPDTWGYGSSMRWWAADRTGDDDPDELPGDGLNSVIHDLPRASTTTVYVEHPATGEMLETRKHNAIIDPDRVTDVEWGYGNHVQAALDLYDVDATRDEIEAAIDAAGSIEDGISRFLDDDAVADVMDMTVGDDALYYIPTDEYEIINPAHALNPLADVIREEELQDDVFGEFRLSRGGGRVSADILFDGKHVDHPGMDDDRKPVCVGLEVNYDFFGDMSFRARGLAMDFECVNSMRAITDWEIVKHSGDIESRLDWKNWWRELLAAIDLKADQIAHAIADADEMELDFGDLPADFAADYDSMLEAFYAYAGLPDYLAAAAANNCRAEAADPFAPTWWELHRGATWAITHRARGEVMGGGSIDQYHRIADDMLMNPGTFEETVIDRYEVAVAEDDQDTIAAEGGGSAQIAEAFSTVREKKEEYENRRDQIEQLIAEAD